MAQAVWAVYEGGALHLAEPLDLEERQMVRVELVGEGIEPSPYPMAMEEVDSTALSAVAYDPQCHVLQIEFQNERVYRYFDVPERVYTGLMEAGSLGRFFNAHIRNEYPTLRLT